MSTTDQKVIAASQRVKPSEAGWLAYEKPSRIETELGGLVVHPLDAGTVRVEAGIPHNAEDAEGFAVNGVSYSVQSFVYRHADGIWRCFREDEPRHRQFGDPRLSRRNVYPDEPTPAAVKKAREVIGEAVGEWATDAGAQSALAWGAYVKRAHDAVLLKKQIEEHAANLKTLRANLRRCDAGGEYSPYPIESR